MEIPSLISLVIHMLLARSVLSDSKEKMDVKYDRNTCTVLDTFFSPLGFFSNSLKQILEKYRCPSRGDVEKLKNSQIPVVWVQGAPGSGKGTMCKRMAEAEGFTHISMGEYIRGELNEKGTNSVLKLGKAVIKLGVPTPAAIALNVLIRRMLQKLDGAKVLLIDGFPKTLQHAKLYQDIIKPPDGIVYLKVSDKTLEHRVLNRGQNRPDDNKNTFHRRIKVFHKEQDSILRDKMFVDKVKEIDGEQNKDGCFRSFSQAIHELIDTGVNKGIKR